MVISEKNLQQNELVDENLRNEFEKQIQKELSADNKDVVRKLLLSHHPADIADFIDKINAEERIKLVNIIKNDFDPALLTELDSSVKKYVIEILGSKKTASLISKLEMDDAAYVLIGLNEQTQNSILKYLTKTDKKNLEELLSYPEDTAGRIMDKKFVSIPGHWTIGKAMDFIRRLKDLPEDFYEIFIVDPKYTPIGSLSLGKILNNPRNVIIKDIMKSNIRSVAPEENVENVSFLFKQYGYVTIPVVSKSNRLIGVITIEDAVEIIEKEAEEDIMFMGGVKEIDFHQDIFNAVRRRFPWLFINLITAHLSVMIISMYETTISQIVALAAIMPIVASIGGNAGTQTMTISVLAIASRELSRLNILRVVIRQVLANILNGFLMAIIGGTIMAIWKSSPEIGLIFGMSIIINFAFAGFFGSVIPLLLKKIGADPAVASPIFLTTLTDALGYLSFLGLATFFLL
jgi:magnesium transporter